MPDRLEEAKLTRLTAQRIRQLAEIDPDRPLPWTRPVPEGWTYPSL